jgi:hypothetical protein
MMSYGNISPLLVLYPSQTRYLPPPYQLKIQSPYVTYLVVIGFRVYGTSNHDILFTWEFQNCATLPLDPEGLIEIYKRA